MNIRYIEVFLNGTLDFCLNVIEDNKVELQKDRNSMKDLYCLELIVDGRKLCDDLFQEILPKIHTSYICPTGSLNIKAKVGVKLFIYSYNNI